MFVVVHKSKIHFRTLLTGSNCGGAILAAGALIGDLQIEKSGIATMRSEGYSGNTHVEVAMQTNRLHQEQTGMRYRESRCISGQYGIRRAVANFVASSFVSVPRQSSSSSAPERLSDTTFSTGWVPPNEQGSGTQSPTKYAPGDGARQDSFASTKQVSRCTNAIARTSIFRCRNDAGKTGKGSMTSA